MSEMNPDLPGASAPAAIPPEPRRVVFGQGWEWIADAWGLFARNPFIWVVDFLLMFFALAILGEFNFVGLIAMSLLLPIVLGGLILGCRAQDRGQPLRVAHLFAGFKVNASESFMLGVFYLVTHAVIGYVAKSVLILGGGAAILTAFQSEDVWAAVAAIGTFVVALLLSLIVALGLLVPVLMALWFAPALVVLRNASAIDALRLSFTASAKNMGPFLLYGVVTLLFAIVASVPAFLGWLILCPLLIATLYTSYRDIFPET